MHLLYKGIHTRWSRKLYIFSTHHSFSEQALGSSFMKLLNILSKLVQFYLPQNTVANSSADVIVFAIAVLHITQS